MRNSHTTPIDLRLVDRLPQAVEGSGLEVSDTRSEQPLSTDSGYAELERPAGLLRWDVQVPPATGSAPWMLDYSYTLTLDRSFHLALAEQPDTLPADGPSPGWQWQQ